jgi:predicted RNase H-like nuclease
MIHTLACSQQITCIGLDLAWSPRNPTGAAVIHGDAHGGVLSHTALLGDLDTIVAYVAQHAGDGPALVAVDAPLRVPNATGRRPAEALLGQVFRAYDAGAHPANRGLPAFRSGVRGELLVEALSAIGIAHDRATVEAGVATRQVVEVYPHPAMVALFGLDKTLKYKAKPNRSLATRRAAWRSYQQHLAGLAQADPPLCGQAAWLDVDVDQLSGRRLKDYEDQADAIICAYVALYAFRWGAARCRAFGTIEEGYIFTPVPEPLRL